MSSRTDRQRREAERAARRAERLAQRAEQRARRQEKQAREAAERAERLAERAQRRPSRERDLDDSIEDFVDKVTEKWTQKAEDWIDEQSGRVFDDDFIDDDPTDEAVAPRRRSRRRPTRARSTSGSRRASRRRSSSRYAGDSWSQRWRDRHRPRGHLYRNREEGKILGVCAGIADYFSIDTWKIRLTAVLGLMFLGQITLPAYFILYFLLDDKPYYRRVTDRFDEGEQPDDEELVMPKRKRDSESLQPDLSNKEALRAARESFGDIEDRLRAMEGHVTSSRFELQRELRKISGDDD